MVLPCLMGAFNSIGGSCFGWVGERIKTEAAHLIDYNANVENLRTQVQNLSDAIKSVEDRIQEAENNQGATLVDAVVDRLLERMASLKEEASKLTRDEERESDSRCLMGLRPNLWACYLASKSAKKAIDKAVELLEEEKKLDRPVANVDFSQSLGVTPFPDFEEFQSRASVSNQIVAALKDPSVNNVGVYGMGGTGKTTLAEKIGAELQLNGTFSYVVLATVSEEQSLLQNNYQSDLTSIQKQIAGGLKIQLQGETLNDRARQLREQLQKRDKVLIILDDIWSKFELEKVGIPVGSSVHTKFKILMTSRSKMVLQNEMDSRNNFGLDSLPFDDAWNLFDRMVGGDSQYSNWRPTAEQVVEECGGIPILLATTGRALRNVNRSIWEDALTKLKEFDGVNYGEEAYKRIEVSYKFLKNEEMKKLFLLCAQLNSRSIGFEELLRYTMGLDLFKGSKTVKKVSGRLHKCLHDLKGCCLLQDGKEEGIIRMHDVVHKFATFVASRDHDVFSVANDGELEEWPSKEQFEKFTAISFFNCRLPSDHELPIAFDDPKLESFLMLRSEIDASFKIPDNFFAGMIGLKLMNLTRMSLSPALVSSLSALVNIRTLCLDHCELGDIAVIGKLRMLQALTLTGSSIVWVPKEIGKLGSTLKLLDLRDCLKLETIASGVISKLTLLEDLRIGKSFTKWKRLEGSDKSSNSADETYEAEVTSLEEFKNLRNLINLEIYIPEHAKMFPKDLVFKKLETFRIMIGSCTWFSVYNILPRTLIVNESSTVDEFDSEGTKALMTRAESLLLKGVECSVSVSEMDPKGFPELKHLQVDSGNGIQYIVKKNYKNCIFQKLETLDLYNLRKLERICDDHDHPRQVGSFENLRVIDVHRCHLLNDLLSSNLARGLLRLEEIRVNYCKSMESIIVSRESENEEEIKIGFTHQLRVLELGGFIGDEGLPRLLSFYRFKQLEGVPSPTPFFNKKIVFPKLKRLELGKMKIEKIWDDHLAISADGTCWLQNLTSLSVYECDNLNYLFTFSMVKSLAKLKQLQVDNCNSIEEIVASTEREVAGEIKLSFPKLDNLQLGDLPNLKRFCHANLLECQLLRELHIEKCLELKTFISTNDSSPDNSTTLFNEKVSFPNMEKLGIDDTGNVKMICGNQLHPNSFSKLKELKIEYQRYLLNAFTPSMWRRALDLENLVIVGCDSLEKVFDVQILPMNERETCRILPFQNLRWVYVSNCPTLTSIFPTSLVQTLQQLERLEVRKFDSLEKVFDVQILPMNERERCRILPFQNLRSVCVSECPTLTSIFPASLVPTLQQLERLEVRKCDSLEKVFDVQILPMNERETCRILPFQNLRSVLVSGCPTLTSIFPASLVPTLQQLEELEVRKCDSLEKVFDVQILPMNERETCRILPFQNLRSVLVSECPTLTSIFPASLVPTLQQLERLEVRKCDSLEKVFDVQILPMNERERCRILPFQNLRSVRVSECPTLTSIFPASLVPTLQQLERLEVRKCDSLEKVFDVQILPMNERETCRILPFQNLRSVLVSECPTLTSIFPASLVPTLQQLEELEVRKCDSLEKVFDVQILPMNERETCRILPFQNLRSVLVSECPTLTSIFPASLVPTLQQLERLEVRKCDKIDLFGFNNTQQLNDAFAKVISSLKYCYLERGGMIVKYEHQRSTWKLKIVGCGFQVTPILYALLKSFPKLDKVVVSSSSIIQLFPCEPDHLAADDGDDMDTQAKTLARIQHLKLTKLSNMKHIWSEHSPLKYHGIPRDPEVLEVVDCDSLLSLAPPSTTLFKNLTGLVVCGCPMLIKLVASSSTAKSLVNLKKMSVTDCDSLEEIVVIDDQWDELAGKDECIVFDKLEVLELQYLNSLTSFCSTSNCNFQFPSLNRVIVENCPKMKFFSKGALSTPKLITVWPFWVEEEDEDEEREENHVRWEGDLNSTIRKLFEENQARWEVKEMEEKEDGDGDRDTDADEDDDSDEHEDKNEDEEV